MKKFIKVFVVLLVSLSLVACSGETDKPEAGNDKGETVTLKVWGAQEEQAFLQERIEAFKKEHEDIDFKIELGVVGEPDAKDQVLQDLDTAADVFAFANDQLMELVEAGALYEITKNKDKIIAENVEGSIDSATLDDKLYAYPMTADNGYFLYYDKSVLSEEDVKSLDKMVAVAEENGKQIFMDVPNGWYIASFFLGAGNKIEIDENGNQLIDFNNETGVKVGEAIAKFVSSKGFVSGDDTVLQAGMGESIIAGVSGTWNAAAMQEKLGENYAATKLPEFTVGDESVQMSSFGGYKLLGVKTSTKFPEEAMMLAEFLTTEESQIARFEARELGPSNIKAAENEKVKENVALAALAQQSEFAQSQKNVLGSYWGPAEAFGVALVNGETSDIKGLLDQMVAQIQEGGE